MALVVAVVVVAAEMTVVTIVVVVAAAAFMVAAVAAVVAAVAVQRLDGGSELTGRGVAGAGDGSGLGGVHDSCKGARASLRRA
jgi:hypothetical protein